MLASVLHVGRTCIASPYIANWAANTRATHVLLVPPCYRCCRSNCCRCCRSNCCRSNCCRCCRSNCCRCCRHRPHSHTRQAHSSLRASLSIHAHSAGRCPTLANISCTPNPATAFHSQDPLSFFSVLTTGQRVTARSHPNQVTYQ